jgi:hypothetical protein
MYVFTELHALVQTVLQLPIRDGPATGREICNISEMSETLGELSVWGLWLVALTG